MQKYTILNKTSLFVKNHLKDVCPLWNITDYPGVVLAKAEDDTYLVFAATRCTIIKQYSSSENIPPPISENIFEEFDNYEDALRMYNYLADIASKLPLFKPSRKMHYICGAEKDVKQATKVLYTPLVNFMEGITLGCYVQVGKSDGYYHIFLNDSAIFSSKDKDDFDETLTELTAYVRNLPHLSITKADLPSWFSLSNKTFWNVVNTFHSFHENEYCKRISLNKEKPEFHITLENENSYFRVAITAPSRNATVWGKDINCYLEISEDFVPCMTQKPYISNAKANKYVYKFEHIDRIDMDTIVAQLNDKFSNHMVNNIPCFTL